jgi:DNA-directed RNA polymerase alpha subunit
MQSNQDQSKESEAFHERLGTRLLSLLQGKQEEKAAEKKETEKEEEFSLEDVKSEMEIIENWVPEKEEEMEKEKEKEKEKMSLLQLYLCVKDLQKERTLQYILDLVRRLDSSSFVASQDLRARLIEQDQKLARIELGLMLVTGLACLSSLLVLKLLARG